MKFSMYLNRHVFVMCRFCHALAHLFKVNGYILKQTREHSELKVVTSLIKGSSSAERNFIPCLLLKD